MPRVSVEIGYSRRWWGNFTVTDNRGRWRRSDFDTYTFTSPSDPRICRTSGQPVSYYLRNNRTAFGAVDNYLTLASNYGDMTYVLAGPGNDRERADEQRPHAAGRLHHRCGHSRSVRRLGGGAREP